MRTFGLQIFSLFPFLCIVNIFFVSWPRLPVLDFKLPFAVSILESAFFFKFSFILFYILSFIIYPISIFILFFCRDGKILLSSHIISQHITWFLLVRSEVVYWMFISIARVPFEGKEGCGVIAVGTIMYRLTWVKRGEAWEGVFWKRKRRRVEL